MPKASQRTKTKYGLNSFMNYYTRPIEAPDGSMTDGRIVEIFKDTSRKKKAKTALGGGLAGAAALALGKLIWEHGGKEKAADLIGRFKDYLNEKKRASTTVQSQTYNRPIPQPQEAPAFDPDTAYLGKSAFASPLLK